MHFNPREISKCQKDEVIAKLRQQLYDLRSKKKGIADEFITNDENQFRLLSDTKARTE